MITPTIDAVKIGTTETLTAVFLSGEGTRRTVVAFWSSEAPEVAAVSDDGRVRGVSLGKTAIHASFQALSADQPLRVVPDYEGTWSTTGGPAPCASSPSFAGQSSSSRPRALIEGTIETCYFRTR